MHRNCLLTAMLVVFAFGLVTRELRAEEVITEPIRTFSGHTHGVNSVAFSPDGGKVLTGSSDEKAKLWDASTGDCIRTFSGHPGDVYSVAFSPDGAEVLTGSFDETAKLWDASTAACIRTFSGHTDFVRSVAFSPDGTKVLTGSDDYTAKLWNAPTGAWIRTFSGHTHWVWSVAFSPDGGKVLTGSKDKTAKLWDASTGACIRTFSGHTGDVTSVAFSPDGGKVLTGSWDNTARLWDAGVAPVAVEDDFSIAEDSGANSLDAMANDRSPRGYPIKIVAKTDGLHGAVVITGGGTGLTYAPAPDYCGLDSFTYTISDRSLEDAATVTITVTNVNDPPDARDDNVIIPLPSNQSIAVVIDVLRNDTYLPDPPETLSVTAVGSPNHGSATLGSGQVSYKADATFAGTDSFSYTISDGNGGTDTATVTVDVQRFTPGPMPDVNGDGCVNVADLIIVRNWLGTGSCR